MFILSSICSTITPENILLFSYATQPNLSLLDDVFKRESNREEPDLIFDYIIHQSKFVTYLATYLLTGKTFSMVGGSFLPDDDGIFIIRSIDEDNEQNDYIFIAEIRGDNVMTIEADSREDSIIEPNCYMMSLYDLKIYIDQQPEIYFFQLDSYLDVSYAEQRLFDLHDQAFRFGQTELGMEDQYLMVYDGYIKSREEEHCIIM